jgi:hypothetical protein
MALLNRQLRGVAVMFGASLLIIIASCKTEYTTQHFSFPPGSKPHENNWDYTLLIVVSTGADPFTKKSKKHVQIKIYDRSKTFYLKDSFDLISASIDANIVWNSFGRVDIELLEVGNQSSKDPYNADLFKTGPRVLSQLTYGYNQEQKQFFRMKRAFD